MNELQIFNNPKFGKVRTLDIEGKPYFVAIDIAKALGYKNQSDAIDRHCRWVVKHDIPHPQNPNKSLEVKVIPEGDLYRLVTHSELPSAQDFEAWVFDEVLPAFRRDGTYVSSTIPPCDIPIGELANYNKEMVKVMIRQNSSPYKIARAFQMVSAQFGVVLPDDFVELPIYEQILLGGGWNEQ